MSAGLRPGRNPLAYLGVDPTTPPMMIVEQRDPTDNDYSGYEIGSLWVVTSIPKMWLMVNKNPSAADKWVQVYPGDGSGTNFFETNSGTASENAGTIKIKGSPGGVLTSMGILDQVSLNLDDDVVIVNSLTVSTMNEGVVVSDTDGLLSYAAGTDLQFLVGETGMAPSFATLVSENFTVTIANGTVPGTVNIQAVGGGGGSGFAGLIGENLVLATPSAEKVSVYGDELADDVSNIYTEASGSKINIFHSDMLNLGDTTSNGKSGVIKLNSNIYFSAYGSNNLFLGKESGSLTLNIISAINNVGVGTYVLKDVDTSLNNTAVGYNSLASLDSGSGGNCCLGYNTGSSIQTGSNNVLIGNAAGSNYSSNESNNIIIGARSGTVGAQNSTTIGHFSTSDCYIRGVYGSTGLATTNGVVLVDNTHKMVSSRGTTGQVLTSTATGVTWATGGTGVSSVGFYATLDSDMMSVTGDGTLITFGESKVFNAIYDYGSNWFAGDGSGGKCYFTAPETGLYTFIIKLYASTLNSDFSQTTMKYNLFNLVTNNRTYSYTSHPSNNSIKTIEYTFLADMSAGHTAYFQFRVGESGDGKYTNIYANDTSQTPTTTNLTSISGFLIR